MAGADFEALYRKALTREEGGDLAKVLFVLAVCQGSCEDPESQAGAAGKGAGHRPHGGGPRQQ